MPVFHHLHHALAIMQAQANWRLWGALIASLPTEAQEEVRTFLRSEARKRQLHENAQLSRRIS